MAPNSEISSNDTPVEEMQEDANKFIVKYRKNYYDISKFLHKHPGGLNTLKGLQNSDMTGRFMKAPPHSDAAMYLMKEYQIKTQKTKTKGKQTTRIKENIEIIEEEEADVDHDDNNNKNNIGIIDESMEVSFQIYYQISV